MNRLMGIGLAVLVLWTMDDGPWTAAPAWASCGSASCPIDTASWERREPGSVSVGYQFEYIDQDEHRIGTRDASFREIRGHHDEEFTLNRTHRFSAAIGITDRWSVDLTLPFVSRAHAHVHRHHGADILEAWDIKGVGDVSLVNRYAVWKPEQPSHPTVSVILGGEFPTGYSHKVNEDRDEAESGIQPGSNSWDLIVGLSSLQTFTVPMPSGRHGMLPLYASAIGQLNGHGNDDYRLGDTLQVNIGSIYPVLPKLGLIGQINLLLKDRDDRGRTGEEIQKTGGEFLYLSPGLELHPSESCRMYAVVQLPVYQRVNLIQTVSDYNVLMGVSYRFGATRK